MSEAKFTKGPWVKDKYGRLIDSNKNEIKVSNFNVLISYPTEESEANRVLLEVASEMYDALDDVIDTIQIMFDDQSVIGIADYLNDNYMRELQALLAKARGDL